MAQHLYKEEVESRLWQRKKQAYGTRDSGAGVAHQRSPGG